MRKLKLRSKKAGFECNLNDPRGGHDAGNVNRSFGERYSDLMYRRDIPEPSRYFANILRDSDLDLEFKLSG